MSEQTIAMIFAGFAVLGTIVTWAFYFLVGKSVWDLRNIFKGTPGDRGKSNASSQEDTEGQR